MPTFYHCGICECYHPANWDGDCRQDSARFAPDELDARFGPLGWTETDMEDVPTPLPPIGAPLTRFLPR